MSPGGVATLAAAALGLTFALGASPPPPASPGISCPTGAPPGPIPPPPPVARAAPPIDARPRGPTEVATFALG